MAAVKERTLCHSCPVPHGYTPTITVIHEVRHGDINAHLKGENSDTQLELVSYKELPPPTTLLPHPNSVQYHQCVNTTQTSSFRGYQYLLKTMTVSHMKSSVSTAPRVYAHTAATPPTDSSTTIRTSTPSNGAQASAAPPTSATQFNPQPHTQNQTQDPSASPVVSVHNFKAPSSQPQTVPSSQTLPHVKSHAAPAYRWVHLHSLHTPLQVISTPQPQITTATQSHMTPSVQTIQHSHTMFYTPPTEQQQIKPGCTQCQPKKALGLLPLFPLL
ncbi:mucin-2-like [Penaeus indicus]|uniref:mucin-2-like n=1 Tax=Penaeus indicus TaxID=29960 RepID=UPI00300C7EA1